jgi:lipopolysaccharide transport system ATP-binding protein
VVIDEGFGLADEYFQRKAQVVLQQLYEAASILVFASHNAELLRATCERGIVLNNGKIVFDGPISEAIDFNHSY